MQLTVNRHKETKRNTHRVEYVAPDRQLVDTVAQKASQVVGDQKSIDQKRRWNFYKGLSGFMNALVILYAKHLNSDD